MTQAFPRGVPTAFAGRVMQKLFETMYDVMAESDVAAAYDERHGIQSQAVLTVFDDETAGLLAEHLAERIAGKTVVAFVSA